jgi:two-component system response regulator ResD
MARILIVDDDAKIRRAVKEFARISGHQTTEASDGVEAVLMCERTDFDLIIMDIMMPDMDGFEAYSRIRRNKDIPAIMLSARGEEYDKLRGFTLGIDDYVVKPFSGRELMARVDVILKRNAAISLNTMPLHPAAGNILKFEGLEINADKQTVRIDGQKLQMTNKMFRLLLFLASNKGVVFTREQLLENVWGYDYLCYDRTVDAHIKMLRHSLGKYRRYIITCKGVGYKFDID